MSKLITVMGNFKSVEYVTELIKKKKHENVFNPSLAVVASVTYVSFRAFGTTGASKFDSFIIKFDSESQFSEEINISELCATYSIAICADPKLVVMENEVWLTFNTGHSENENAIYLMKVSNKIGKPYQCILESREKIEKNWAFFKDNNHLHAVYSLTPLVKLKLSNICEQKNIFYFKFLNDDLADLKYLQKKSNLSIGTQLLKINDSYNLIAHEKIKIGRKRVYFGRFVEIKNSTVVIHKKRLIHSYASLLGSRIKHNKNLISCTYFSGLAADGEDFIISYGVNDISFDVKRIPQQFL